MSAKKFFEIVRGFSVAIQSNFPADEPAEKFLKPGVGPAELVINKEKGQIFHPAVLEELKFSGGRVAEIHFAVVTNGKEKWKKLVFFSKCRAAAARFGETEPFGFDKTRPGPDYKGHDYLLLALPGITGRFESVYFKVQPKGGRPIYIQISIEKDNGDFVIVKARMVTSRHCPPHLFFK